MSLDTHVYMIHIHILAPMISNSRVPALPSKPLGSRDCCQSLGTVVPCLFFIRFFESVHETFVVFLFQANGVSGSLHKRFEFLWLFFFFLVLLSKLLILIVFFMHTNT